ncbi:MAG: phage portal protein, partial [Oscillospiraceae bacterium]
MGLFRRKKEVRADENSGEVQFDDALLRAALGGDVLSRAAVLGIPTVQACISMIADTISMLPIKMYERADGEIREGKDDRRLFLLNNDTGDTMNATEMKKAWVYDYFLGKGAYTYIERDIYAMPKAIRYVEENRITVNVSDFNPISKDYTLSVGGNVYAKSDFIKILRNSKGYGSGTSVITENPEIFAVYYYTMLFEKSTVKKGGNKKGFFTSQKQQTEAAMARVKAAFAKVYSNSQDAADSVIVLNEGMDFKESSATSVEMQLNENKVTNAGEICKIFGVPQEMLSGRASEQVRTLFVSGAIMPVINIIEAALDSDFLLEREKATRYYAFDTKEITRGNMLERYRAYEIALKNRFLMIDEVREQEDQKPTGLNYLFLGLQDVLLNPETGQMYTPNTNAWTDLNQAAANIKDGAAEEVRSNPYHDPKNGQFTSANGVTKAIDKSKKSGIIKSQGKKSESINGSGHIKDNIEIGRSVGASGKNYPVKLPDGNHSKFAEGTEIVDIKTFAGKGTNVPIREAIFLENDYGIKAEKWEKVRGTGYVLDK